ncbi:MAG: aminopeptidase [Luteolibacter sp.]
MRCILFLPLILLQSCETISFYAQGVSGQIEILSKSRANRRVIDDKETPQDIREKLLLCKELTDFAKNELNLPGDASYHKYTDLGRKHVVFVLHAAPEFSLEPKTWFYPVIGEMDYRGYFNEADAQEFAEKLEAQGYEVHLGGTDAYSTLGFFHDPVLNTFIDYSDIDFADMIFHELTHRRIFRNGETTFNESLANAVAEEGIRRWLNSKGDTTALRDYEERLIRRREFYAEINHTRVKLEKLYASGISVDEMRKTKSELLNELKSRADVLQKRWGGKALEEWISQDLTNAHLLALVTYNSEIPKFRELIEQCNGDFELFFKKVKVVDLETD